MAVKKNPRDKIRQISVGFTQKQIEFLYEYQDIDINRLCRDSLDKQITLINPKYL